MVNSDVEASGKVQIGGIYNNASFNLYLEKKYKHDYTRLFYSYS